MNENEKERLEDIRSFYNSSYHKKAKPSSSACRHLQRLARKLKIRKNQQVLDVACGTGEWLLACRELGAATNGVDLSENAITVCKTSLPDGEFYSSPAENLPFEENRFDVITCLGALEHFIDPQKALQEMIRVSNKDAIFILLVPNTDFLTRKLGLYSGTSQADIKEDVRTLDEWGTLFEAAGLTVKERWRDLHVLSWSWIAANGWCLAPVRLAQA